MEYLCTLNITTSDKLSNCRFIDTFEDLNRIIADNTTRNKITLRKDFIDTYFPYGTVSHFVTSVKKINPSIVFETEEYELHDTIDMNVLDDLRTNLTQDELLLLVSFKSADLIGLINNLISHYDKTINHELEWSSLISSLRETIDSKNSEIASLKEALNKEQINKRDVQDKLSVLINRINYSHDVGIDEKMLFRSEGSNYDKVIYIKEVTRVQYVDTLVSTLQEICRYLYEMPTRLLVIESYYSSGKVDLYPNLIPHYKTTEKDILSGDILMLGYQPRMFKDIMRNPSNISIMIILDRGGYCVPHLDGDNVVYLYTASDPKRDCPNIPENRIISYEKENLYIPYVKDFNELTTMQKVQKYSSMKIMKQIQVLLE